MHLTIYQINNLLLHKIVLCIFLSFFIYIAQIWLYTTGSMCKRPCVRTGALRFDSTFGHELTFVVMLLFTHRRCNLYA